MEQHVEQRTLDIMKMIDVIIHDVVGNKQLTLASRQHLPTAYFGMMRLRNKFGVKPSNDRIVDFALYQVYRYKEHIASYPASYFQFTWLFADTAVEQYKQQFYSEKGKEGMRWYIDKWLEESKYNRAKLINLITDHSINRWRQYIYLDSEEPTKKRWLNKQNGLMLCLKSTTGWSPKSPSCQQCKFTMQCIEASKKKYPEIIRLRQQEK